ncbi:unnamed protein product [Polarella glacialis]|uniref:Uncharacterized protein n=3 Tax=Polarella glacialis TaxID=89957 RepID=A0A813FZX7_POLGL|nr:unnamed protein product [Polarella glacialis]
MLVCLLAVSTPTGAHNAMYDEMMQERRSGISQEFDQGAAGFRQRAQQHLGGYLLEIKLKSLQPRPSSTPCDSLHIFGFDIEIGCPGSSQRAGRDASIHRPRRHTQVSEDSVPPGTKSRSSKWAESGFHWIITEHTIQ